MMWMSFSINQLVGRLKYKIDRIKDENVSQQEY